MVVPVDLYGQCCDLEPIVAACDRWGVPVMCDSAAAMGATGRGGLHQHPLARPGDEQSRALRRGEPHPSAATSLQTGKEIV